MNSIKKNSLYLIFAVSFISMLASLFFSEVMKWAPCVLCWYQRILLYPIAIISVVAIIRKDIKAYTYILPMAILGVLVAIYHNLLYFNILPESALPCLNGVSCTTEYIEWFGFITIPFLSLCAFILLIVLALFVKRSAKELQSNN